MEPNLGIQFGFFTMQKIPETLDRFQQALIEGRPLICDDRRSWSYENRVVSWLRHVIHREGSRDIAVVRSFQRCLEDLEKVPVLFNAGHPNRQQLQNLVPFTETAKHLVRRYNDNTSKLMTRQITGVIRQVVALQYRLGIDDGNATPEESRNQLQQLATQWKEKRHNIDGNSLTDDDLQQLQQAYQYPHFVQLLLKDSKLLKTFLKWSLRDNLSVDIFVQYPATQKRLTASYLDKRIGHISRDALKIQQQTIEDNTPQIKLKVVTVPMENLDVDILDESDTHTFKHDYRLTIKQIFDSFRNKNITVGNLEYTSAGIINWNVFKLGSWNPKAEQYEMLDLTQKRWWKQLPAVRVISAKEVEQRYEHNIGEGEYGVCAMGSRSSPNRNGMAAHCWLEMILPVGEGKYQVLPFGKFTEFFAKEWHEYISLFSKTYKAQIEYPDENPFRTNREQAGVFFPLDNKQFDRLLERLRQDLIKAREGNLIFQALGDNCGYWVQDIIDELIGKDNVPRLYDIAWYDEDLFGALKTALGPFQQVKNPWLRDFLYKTLLLRLLGAGRGITVNEDGQQVFKSVATGSFWDTNIEQNPAILVDKVVKGELPRVFTLHKNNHNVPALAV